MERSLNKNTHHLYSAPFLTYMVTTASTDSPTIPLSRSQYIGFQCEVVMIHQNATIQCRQNTIRVIKADTTDPILKLNRKNLRMTSLWHILVACNFTWKMNLYEVDAVDATFGSCELQGARFLVPHMLTEKKKKYWVVYSPIYSGAPDEIFLGHCQIG